jgi:HEAT repeat protein
MTADLAALTGALESEDNARRQSAAEQLSQLGSDAQPAAVALVNALASGAVDDEATREWVVAALEDLGPPSTDDVARLAALLSHRSLDAAYWAATLLGRLQAEAAPAVGALAEALSGHAELSVRQRAAWALGQIGATAGPAQGALEEAAASSDRRLAALAREAIGQLRG